MKLTAPRFYTFVIAVVLALVGFIIQLVNPDLLFANFGFWLLVVGFVLLAIGNLFEGI
jgi:Flp pilus assembly protein TadB